jgi:hypothetical protein
VTPWYTDQEIDDLCEGLINNAAKVRYLRSMGLTVMRKPNGKPLLMRAHADLILAGLPSAPAPTDTEARTGAQPNLAGLIAQFKKG